MKRYEILEVMSSLQLAGMHAAFDEVVANGLKRQHPVPQIIADLLKAALAEKQAHSIRYRLAIAKRPLAKELADFAFAGTPINEALVRELAAASFLAPQRCCAELSRGPQSPQLGYEAPLAARAKGLGFLAAALGAPARLRADRKTSRSRGTPPGRLF